MPLATLADGLHGFPRSLQENQGIVLQLGNDQLLQSSRNFRTDMIRADAGGTGE